MIIIYIISRSLSEFWEMRRNWFSAEIELTSWKLHWTQLYFSNVDKSAQYDQFWRILTVKRLFERDY